MPKLILILLLLPVFASAQIVSIPDSIFKASLVANDSINTNGDSEIQISEASAFTGIIACSFCGISDLTGIEAFTSITFLQVHDNSLTSLDITNNTALISVDCNNNLITALDITQNTALQALGCWGNSLTSLDARNGNNNNMTTFDATNNPDLSCISVDDSVYSNANWNWGKDSWATYSNDCSALGIKDNQLNQPSITSHNRTITIKGKGTTTIFNLRGQRVHHSKVNGNASISLKGGIYLVRVTSDGRSVTKKVYLSGN